MRVLESTTVITSIYSVQKGDPNKHISQLSHDKL